MEHKTEGIFLLFSVVNVKQLALKSRIRSERFLFINLPNHIFKYQVCSEDKTDRQTDRRANRRTGGQMDMKKTESN